MIINKNVLSHNTLNKNSCMANTEKCLSKQLGIYSENAATSINFTGVAMLCKNNKTTKKIFATMAKFFKNFFKKLNGVNLSTSKRISTKPGHIYRIDEDTKQRLQAGLAGIDRTNPFEIEKALKKIGAQIKDGIFHASEFCRNGKKKYITLDNGNKIIVAVTLKIV